MPPDIAPVVFHSIAFRADSLHNARPAPTRQYAEPQADTATSTQQAETRPWRSLLLTALVTSPRSFLGRRHGFSPLP